MFPRTAQLLFVQFAEVVDGRWNEWTEWNPTCEQMNNTCKNIVQTRERQCDKPKPNNGDDCTLDGTSGNETKTIKCGGSCPGNGTEKTYIKFNMKIEQ